MKNSYFDCNSNFVELDGSKFVVLDSIHNNILHIYGVCDVYDVCDDACHNNKDHNKVYNKDRSKVCNKVEVGNSHSLDHVRG